MSVVAPPPPPAQPSRTFVPGARVPIPAYIEDALSPTCALCQSNFTQHDRPRDYCRACGIAVCHECTERWIFKERITGMRPQIVDKLCYAELCRVNPNDEQLQRPEVIFAKIQASPPPRPTALPPPPSYTPTSSLDVVVTSGKNRLLMMQNQQNESAVLKTYCTAEENQELRRIPFQQEYSYCLDCDPNKSSPICSHCTRLCHGECITETITKGGVIVCSCITLPYMCCELESGMEKALYEHELGLRRIKQAVARDQARADGVISRDLSTKVSNLEAQCEATRQQIKAYEEAVISTTRSVDEVRKTQALAQSNQMAAINAMPVATRQQMMNQMATATAQLVIQLRPAQLQVENFRQLVKAGKEKLEQQEAELITLKEKAHAESAATKAAMRVRARATKPQAPLPVDRSNDPTFILPNILERLEAMFDFVPTFEYDVQAAWLRLEEHEGQNLLPLIALKYLGAFTDFIESQFSRRTNTLAQELFLSELSRSKNISFTIESEYGFDAEWYCKDHVAIWNGYNGIRLIENGNGDEEQEENEKDLDGGDGNKKEEQRKNEDGNQHETDGAPSAAAAPSPASAKPASSSKPRGGGNHYDIFTTVKNYNKKIDLLASFDLMKLFTILPKSQKRKGEVKEGEARDPKYMLPLQVRQDIVNEQPKIKELQDRLAAVTLGAPVLWDITQDSCEIYSRPEIKAKKDPVDFCVAMLMTYIRTLVELLEKLCKQDTIIRDTIMEHFTARKIGVKVYDDMNVGGLEVHSSTIGLQFLDGGIYVFTATGHLQWGYNIAELKNLAVLDIL